MKNTIPIEKRLFILSKSYSLIREYFAHWQNVKDLDFDKWYQDILQQAIEIEVRYEFNLLMIEFLAKLNNGHTFFFDNKLWRKRFYLGFKIKPIDKNWCIVQSSTENLKVGSLVEKINGQDFKEFYMQKRKYLNASNEQSRKYTLSSRPFLFPEVFTLELQSSEEIEIKVKPLADKKSLFTDFETEGKWIKKSEIAYIKIPSFNEPRFEEKAVDYCKDFLKTKKIIIDVRGNSGGSTPSKLHKQLMNKPYRWWTESTNLQIGLLNYYNSYYQKLEEENPEEATNPIDQGWYSITSLFKDAHLLWSGEETKPIKDAYQGDLIILVDAYTHSAAEDFTMPFKDNGRAIIIGETTKGSTGQPYSYSFYNEFIVMIGTKRAYFPDGSLFEGKGIEPDIPIETTVEDYKKGIDPILQKALSI
ncbi:MAG: hypothetical protein HZR80_12645 [Candidatus Heimdallarchaeota archaeon]